MEISRACTEVITAIRESKGMFSDQEFQSLNALHQLLKRESEEKRESIAVEIQAEIFGDPYHKIYLYSYLLNLIPQPEWMRELLEVLLDTEGIPWQTLYFASCQIRGMGFRQGRMNSAENTCLRWRLQEKVLRLCKEQITVPLNRIPKEELNDNMAVVLVEQFLVEQHGPTKTVLDRCHILKKHLKRQVLLINTAEMQSSVGIIPWFGAKFGTYREELLNSTSQSWKGEEIPYFQCENDMPNLMVMEVLLNKIRQLKPGIAVLVGGSSLFAGLVNELVPVLNVGTITSEVATTLADYQTVNQKFIQKNEKLLFAAGRKMEHVIPGSFTYSLKEQTEHVTRQDVGLPEHDFIIGIVGSRLNAEITEELLELMERMDGKNISFYLLGGYTKYGEDMKRHLSLCRYVFNGGYCEDILSRISLCDLYLNPLRRGGGTSSVEAMSKGKPVVTINYGDVAGVVGEDFYCSNYQEMEHLILKYKSDKDFYEKQSAAARKIAAFYLDTEREFKRIIDEYKKRCNEQ